MTSDETTGEQAGGTQAGTQAGMQAGTRAKAQADFYALAERNLPGAGLGGYSLPDDVRFIVERGVGSRLRSVEGRWYIDYVSGAGANILGLRLGLV